MLHRTHTASAIGWMTKVTMMLQHDAHRHQQCHRQQQQKQQQQHNYHLQHQRAVLYVVVLSVSLCLLQSFAPAAAANVYVSPTGSDTSSCGLKQATPCQSWDGAKQSISSNNLQSVSLRVSGTFTGPANVNSAISNVHTNATPSQPRSSHAHCYTHTGCHLHCW